MEQVFLSYHRTEKAAADSSETKAAAEWGEKTFRKLYSVSTFPLQHKTLSIRTDNHEGDTSRKLKEVRFQMVLLELSI